MIKTYIIRLESSPISFKLAEDAFNAAKSFQLDVQYFKAIDKSNVDDFFTANNLVSKKYPAMEIAGTRACFASHYSLWKMCAETEEPFLVLEHDGVVIRDPRNVIFKVSDVCHMDPYSPFDSTYDKYVNLWDGERLVEYTRKYVKTEYGKDIITEHRCSYINGSYGYIIKPHAAKRLYDYYKSNECIASDEAICNSIVKLQRTSSTYVRLHPFLKDRETIIKYCTRKRNV